MARKKSTYEGLQQDVRKLTMPRVETWQNKYPDKDYTITIDFPEFTCICPKTDLPDFATIHVTYVPDKMCLELKSLKLYMIAYRSVGIFHEHAVNRILEDLVKAAHPRRMQITGEFNVRGGVRTTVAAEYAR
jgi:7-cyano-7-deazaguanine reductase